MPLPARAPIAALRSSHERLAGLAAGMGAETAGEISYCTGWTVAQVFSHIGSGSEIGLDSLAAAIEHREPMGRDEVSKIWDTWNGRAPLEQVAEAVRTSAALVEAYESASDESLAEAQVTLFGTMTFDGFGLAGFRLPELAVHTWDVAVTLDPSARVLPDAVELIIDGLPGRIGWFGKPQGRHWAVTVETTDPARTFTLASADAVTLAPAGDTANAAPDGTLRLPAEAFLRLTFGRLDEANADGADVSGASVTLDELRATFPGF
jgi:uncharacterized protein (TIGR03083 family)